MENTSQIVSAVGRDQIKAMFGVNDRVILHYVKLNQLPASWFAALEKATGQALNRALFSFKGC